MRPFDLARPAQRDFLQAIEFLETRNPEAALRWERRLVSELFDIAAGPLLSPIREEFASAPRRVRVFGKYLIIYDPSRDPIVILRIVHASRDLVVHASRDLVPVTTDLFHNGGLYACARQAASFIHSRTVLRPRLAIVLGSGLNEIADQVSDAIAIPYTEIPHFPRSTVDGHAGRLVIGTLAGVPVIVMQGRVHAYEGYTMEQVTFATRVLGLLGIRELIVTNAAGGINPSFSPGTIVGIRDHINLTGMNAAAGANEPRFAITPDAGLRFFDMTTAYSPRLLQLAIDVAAQQGWSMSSGVYLAVLGPSYETPAEIRAFRTLGADLVGMSTVHEVIVARHMGMEVLGLSLVTNPAAGVTGVPLHHLEVMEVGARAAQRFGTLLTDLVPRVDAQVRS